MPPNRASIQSTNPGSVISTLWEADWLVLANEEHGSSGRSVWNTTFNSVSHRELEPLSLQVTSNKHVPAQGSGNKVRSAKMQLLKCSAPSKTVTMLPVAVRCCAVFRGGAFALEALAPCSQSVNGKGAAGDGCSGEDVPSGSSGVSFAISICDDGRVSQLDEPFPSNAL